MAAQQITAADITNWNSLEDIAKSFEKRGLKPQSELGEENRFVLELADGEFIELVQAGTGKSATDYKPGSITRHTNLVATNDYETFTFVTRVRDWDAHGRIKHQQFSFKKDQFRRDSGEKNTVLQKLNEIEYGQSVAVMEDLYDTRKIVKEFYEQFESLRIDLVQEVNGIPEDRGDAKQRYVQVLLDRMIFLYFIQEKNLLDYDADYLHNHHKRVTNEGGDVFTEFYNPLFFDLLAEGKDDPEFGKLPYLNGGLFSKNPIEEEFDNAKLGESADETNKLFGRILDFFSDWNWNVDERLDIVDPKNLSPAVLGHIFEQTVNQQEMGAYYTPEEITGFMARRTIHPYLLDQLNEAEGTAYESIDDVFSLDTASAEKAEKEAIADGGIVAHGVDTEGIEQDHIETFYFDVLKEIHLVDPAVGSGAFLLAAQEVLLDVYLQCIEYFVAQEDNEPWELTSQIKSELDKIRNKEGNETLYAKREIILNNLYGVDIDRGAVEICKLRLWLSMVADLEDEPDEVDPLPNIDFNVQTGNSLIGHADAGVHIDDDGRTDLNGWEKKTRFDEIREAIQKHKTATSPDIAKKWREEAEKKIEKHRPRFDQILVNEFQNVGLEDVSLDELQEWSPLHWPLQFPDVYEKGGFDIVIGNPPYEGQDRIGYKKQLRKRASEKYGYDYPAKTDMFQFFVHRGLELVRNDGYYSFIINDTFLMNRNKADVRQAILPNLTELTTVNRDAFDVSIGTAIFRTKKGASPTTIRYNASRDAPIASYTELLDIDEFVPSQDWEKHTLSIAERDSHRVYELNKDVYEESFRNVLYEPSVQNMEWHQRFFSPVMETYADWEKEIGNARSLRASRTEVCRKYLQNLGQGDICLFGLYAEGGRGVKTDNITDYVGVMDGTKKSETIREQGYYNRKDSQITTIVSEDEIADVSELSQQSLS